MTDPLMLVRAADPAAGLDPDHVTLDAALDRQLTVASGPALAAVPAATARVRRHRGRAFGVVVATAAACGAALVVALPGGGGSDPGLADASAATVLRSARTAALAPGQAGPWTAVIVRDWRNEPFRTPGGGWADLLVPYTVEQWASDDGERLSRSTRGTDLRFPDPSDRAAYAARADRAQRPDPRDGRLVRLDVEHAPGPTVADVHAWPTDPAALAQRLADGGSDVVHHATGMLLSPLVTAEQRAALYSVLLRQPGARLEAGVTDPEGRTGDAVRFVSHDDRPGTDHINLSYDTTLLFDRETHALLGVREGTGRTSTGWSVVLEARRAAAAPAPDLVQRFSTDRSKPPAYVPAR
jgi:hypothetical protein